MNQIILVFGLCTFLLVVTSLRLWSRKYSIPISKIQGSKIGIAAATLVFMLSCVPLSYSIFSDIVHTKKMVSAVESFKERYPDISGVQVIPMKDVWVYTYYKDGSSHAVIKMDNNWLNVEVKK